MQPPPLAAQHAFSALNWAPAATRALNLARRRTRNEAYPASSRQHSPPPPTKPECARLAQAAAAAPTQLQRQRRRLAAQRTGRTTHSRAELNRIGLALDAMRRIGRRRRRLPRG